MLFLFGVITQFAVSIITTPITFVAMWRTYVEYFRMLGSMRQSTPDPEALSGVLSGMGFGAGISASLSFMLTMLIEPVYLTLLYFDLRARRGEFPTPEPQPPEQGPPPQDSIQ